MREQNGAVSKSSLPFMVPLKAIVSSTPTPNTTPTLSPVSMVLSPNPFSFSPGPGPGPESTSTSTFTSAPNLEIFHGDDVNNAYGTTPCPVVTSTVAEGYSLLSDPFFLSSLHATGNGSTPHEVQGPTSLVLNASFSSHPLEQLHQRQYHHYDHQQQQQLLLQQQQQQQRMYVQHRADL